MVGQHTHVIKTGGKQRVNCFGAARERDVALAVLDRADRLQDRDRAAGARGGVAEPRAARVVIVRHHRTGRVWQPLLPPGLFAWRNQLVLQRIPLDDVIGVAHVSADRAAKPVAVDAAEMDAGVGHRLGRRLPAERNILELARELAFDVDGCAEHHPVGNSGHIGQPLNAAVATLNCLPHRLARVADGRDQPDAGYHNAIVVRRLMAH